MTEPVWRSVAVVAMAVRGVLGLPARLLDVLVPVATAQVLRRVDLTALVIRYVDLDRVAARIDVNAVARRIDLDALLAAADLPEIIRESTGTLASDTVRRARMRGIAADEAVDQARNRLLRRDVRPP